MISYMDIRLANMFLKREGVFIVIGMGSVVSI